MTRQCVIIIIVVVVAAPVGELDHLDDGLTLHRLEITLL